MQPAKVSLGSAALWLASWCLLATGEPSEHEAPLQTLSPQLDFANWPHPTKSATLVPSFTKTPPQKHTTTHHHHRHTSTTTPANHTSHPHNTSTPRTRTTTHHVTTTTAPANHTSHSHNTSTPRMRTTTHHITTTTAPANHTSHSHTSTPRMRTTTHHATTTTAPANHTSSPAHPTTHHIATSTSAPANHSSPAHHTSHPHPTTPRPPQPPDVLVGNYTVKEGSTVCLRAEMGLQLRVRYADTAQRQAWGAFAVQPNQTDVSGNCSSKTATLKLHFPEGFILFTFQKNETEKAAYLHQVQASLTYQFPRATEKTFRANNASLREFAAPLGKSYQCRNRSLDLTEDFRLSALSQRIQAFQLQDGKFGEAELCPEQKRSVVLPIVVGVVLGLLILIVLVAFAVGRWRAHTGYESL